MNSPLKWINIFSQMVDCPIFSSSSPPLFTILCQYGMGIYKRKKESEQESKQARVHEKKKLLKKKKIQVVLISRINKSYKVVESKIDWYFS